MSPEELLAALDAKAAECRELLAELKAAEARSKERLSDLRSTEKTMRKLHKDFMETTMRSIVKDFEERMDREVEEGLTELHQALRVHREFVDREMNKTVGHFKKTLAALAQNDAALKLLEHKQLPLPVDNPK